MAEPEFVLRAVAFGGKGEGDMLVVEAPPPPMMRIIHIVPENPAEVITRVDPDKIQQLSQQEMEADLARFEAKKSRSSQQGSSGAGQESFVLLVQVKSWLDLQGLGVDTARKFHSRELVEFLHFPPEEAVNKALDRISGKPRGLR